jgi:hypothetical protein
MRKIIAVLLVLVLLMTLGCAAKRQAQAPSEVAKNVPVSAPAEGATASAITDVDKELGEIDSIDSDLSSDELDSLDSDLNFNI